MDKEEDEKVKIGIIVAYFGTLPSYFQIFLDSCRCNPKFDWLIYTDDVTEYHYPQNVHRIVMNFDECKRIIQSHFNFSIALKSPKKLCDYKCAYGYIFQDYLSDYDWWGHCDLDQVFGNLEAFITDERLNTVDKIYSIGHLTLYRNTEANNQIFMSKIEGKARYKEVFTTDRGMGFDEWLPNNVNDIFLYRGVPAIYKNEGADIDSYHTSFVLVDYDITQQRYIHSTVKNSIFLWRKGKLYQLYMQDRKLKRSEFPYVHLQKRRMIDKRKSASKDSFYIIPNCFIDGNHNPYVLLKRSEIWTILNWQFFKVKFQSLKYRIKSGDWKRQNVFD